MKKLGVFSYVILIVACANSFSLAQISASLPRMINYQGYVADAANKPVNGLHKITVRLYDAPVEGSLLHAESFSSLIDNGVFSVEIGSVLPIEASLDFTRQYWLGISIDEGTEFIPRTAFVSVPYALHAATASALSQNAKGAVLSLNGKSGDIVLQGGAGTQIQTDGKTITISSSPVSVGGNAQIQATSVTSVTGTSNQVTANPTTGAVVLSLPQNINTGASPTFAGMTLSNFGSGIVHSNGSGALSSSLISNGDVAGGANIAYSKLNLVSSISNNDIANGANIAYSKLNLVGSISNADVANGANISASKLNLTNAITTGDIANGTIVNADVNAAANIAYSKLNLVGSISNADVAGGANIAYSKLNLVGSISNNDVANGANISATKLNLTNAITTGDIANGTIVNADVNGAANIAYSKLNLAGSIVNADVAGGANIADSKLATIATAGKVSNSATTATSANNASTIVLRNGSGNFSAGTITATLNGNATNVTGTVQETNGGTGTASYNKGDILYASGANTLSKRAIGATGQVLTITNGVPVWSALSGVGVTSATGTVNQVLVNGGSGIQTTGGITLSLPQDIHAGASPAFVGMTLSGLNTNGIVHNVASGTLSTSLIVDADVSAIAAIADSKLATISTVGKVANSATTATSSNTNNTIVLRDGSGNFSAGTITAGALNVTGKATSASTANADAATTLATKDYVDNIATEYWSITGNSGTNSSTNYFGTSDANDLSLSTNATERMRIMADGSLLLSGTSGVVPASGAGTRMMWIPSLGAFRAGTTSGSEWNSGNVGSQSVAFGNGTLASGAESFAAGYFNSAYGIGSVALGSGTAAYADGSIAMGSAAQAVGINSVAMGDNTEAWDNGSTAIGSNTNAHGVYSTAMGYKTTTANDNGTAMGSYLTVGLSSFGFNGSTTNTTVDVSGMNNVAYFGDADLMIGNDDNLARSLKFYGANNTADLSGAFYSSFKAGVQSVNISYTLPVSQGAANSFLTNDGSGSLSWSSLGTLNIPTGSGTANNLAIWNSTSALGASSNLYYSSSKLGIGVPIPAQALDVSGNANISGTLNAGGINMTGGSAVLSYGTITAGATIAIPNNAVVKITDDNANAANKVSMPAGTNGQIIYIYNNDAQATTGDITLGNNTMGVYVYVDGWIKAN